MSARNAKSSFEVTERWGFGWSTRNAKHYLDKVKDKPNRTFIVHWPLLNKNRKPSSVGGQLSWIIWVFVGANSFPIISDVRLCKFNLCIVNHFINKLLLPEQSCIFESSYAEGSQSYHKKTVIRRHSRNTAWQTQFSLDICLFRIVNRAVMGAQRNVAQRRKIIVKIAPWEINLGWRNSN